MALPPGTYTFPTLQRPALEPLAVAALATSPLAPVGLGLGIVALGRISRDHTRGRGLAIGAIIISSLILAGLALTLLTLILNGSLARAGESPSPGDVSAERTIATVNLAGGNCVATLPVSRTVGEVTVVPCGGEHLMQVLSTPAAGTGDYPGEDALFRSAALTCGEAFEGAGPPAGFEPWFLVPSERSWDNGYHHHVCLARSTAGPITIDIIN